MIVVRGERGQLTHLFLTHLLYSEKSTLPIATEFHYPLSCITDGLEKVFTSYEAHSYASKVLSR